MPSGDLTQGLYPVKGKTGKSISPFFRCGWENQGSAFNTSSKRRRPESLSVPVSQPFSPFGQNVSGRMGISLSSLQALKEPEWTKKIINKAGLPPRTFQEEKRHVSALTSLTGWLDRKGTSGKAWSRKKVSCARPQWFLFWTPSPTCTQQASRGPASCSEGTASLGCPSPAHCRASRSAHVREAASVLPRQHENWGWLLGNPTLRASTSSPLATGCCL